MSTITTRSGKGSPLTHNEVDANFTNLNTDKYQSGDNVTFGTATVTTFTSTGIDDNAVSTAITIDSSQDVTFTSDAKFPDSGKAIFGAGSDLEIYHDGSNSYVRESGTGNLIIAGSDKVQIYEPTFTNLSANFDTNGLVGLYYNGSQKFATTSTGIDVTGDVNSDSVTTGTFTSTGIDDNATSTAITINASQNVGIGTTSLGSGEGKLAVLGSNGTGGNGNIILAKFGGNLAVQNRALQLTEYTVSGINNVGFDFNAPGAGSQAAISFSTLSTERLRINSNGTVTIGTPSQSTHELAVREATSPRITIDDTGGTSTSVNSALLLRYDTTTAGYVGFVGGVDLGINNNLAGDIVFSANSGERMRLDSSGRVGIGTASPSSFNQVGADTLVVGSGSGEQGITIYSGTANNGVLAFADGITTTQQYQGYIGYNHSSSFMRFFTGATERMRIDSVGSMGLGTAGAPNTLSASATTLNIKGSVTTKTGAIWLQSSDESLSSYLYQDSSNLTLGTLSNHALRFVTNNSEKARLDTSGNLLVGRTSTANSATDYGHQLYGSGQLYIFSSSGGTADVIRGHDSTGANTFAIDADGTYQDLSDARYKENIALSERGLSDIMGLNVVSFDWSNRDGHVTSGFIAQEVQQSMPELIGANEDTGDLRMKTGRLIPVLTKALQEQQAMIEELKTEVAALKGA